MPEETTTPQTIPAPTGSVMDVQPPRPGTTITVTAPQSTVSPEAPASVAPAPEPAVAAPAPTPAPVPEAPAAPSPAPVAEVSPEPPIAASPEAAAPSTDVTSEAGTDAALADKPLDVSLGGDKDKADKVKKTSKRRLPIGAIIAAVVALLILGGLTVYAMTKSKSDTAVKNKDGTSNVRTPITTADITKASDDVDGLLNQADDSKDFSATDLSDAALGIQ